MKTDSVHARAMVRLDRAAWFATVAGMCGSLVSIGLARFAYTPLIPPLIQAHWFSPANAVSLGVANFAGYLAGALLARLIATALSNRQALRLLMFRRNRCVFCLRLSAICGLVLCLEIRVRIFRRRDYGPRSYVDPSANPSG